MGSHVTYQDGKNGENHTGCTLPPQALAKQICISSLLRPGCPPVATTAVTPKAPLAGVY